jgi:hypothetical protein
MQLNWLFHALWMLCAMSVAVFAATPWRHPWIAVVVSALAFAATSVVLAAGGWPDAALIGGLTLLAAVGQLIRPGPMEAITAATTGVIAAAWAALLRVEGAPPLLASALAVALPLLCAYFSRRRPDFAPPVIREEGLVIVSVVGVIVATAPSVTAGWHSAMALNLVDKANASAAAANTVPGWTLGIVAASTLCGGAFRLWRNG